MSLSVHIRRAAWAVITALLVAGCETVPLEPSPNFTGDMAVAIDYAQFFKLGPQQAGGADFSLRTGERVMLQRKEFGYSRVQLENGLVGYMANEDITPAPPEPKPTPGQRKSGSRNRGSSRSQPVTYEDDFESLPIPDLNLDILPEDVPLEPLPDLLPDPAPTPAAPAPAPEPTPIKEGIPETAPDAAPPVSTST
jgi:hypothetical protein